MGGLTPAALTFLRDLYTQRGEYEYRAGHPLEAAKATAFEVVEVLRAGMEDGTFVELDGKSVVEQTTIKQPSSNYTQGELL